MTALSPPVIKFPEDILKPKTWARIRDEQVIPALMSHGCFTVDCGDLKGNRNKLFKTSKDIFVSLAKTNSGKKNDQCESIDILEATADKSAEKFISTVPQGNKLMSETILGYTRTAAEEVEKQVREMVLEHCKLPKESTGYIFRMMRNREEVRLGCSDNTNRIEFLAVLDLNQVDSLDMKYNGKRFKIDVKPSTFLIMAGKPLKDWGEGKIHPLGLQVKMHGNKEKYSVGLFSYCKKQVGSSSGS